MNKLYLCSVVLLMLVLPVVSITIEHIHSSGQPLLALTGKWFVFWALGLRLLTAGLRQVIKPAFTARNIFHIEDIKSHVIVRELGFANICFGLTAVFSLFIPEWRTAAAFAGGLYMGIAGFYHFIKKPDSANEVLAMVSDLFILVVMGVYLWVYFIH